jgi:hypothetical protein
MGGFQPLIATAGNGEVAPIPAVVGTTTEPLESTQLRHRPRGLERPLPDQTADLERARAQIWPS